MGYQYSNLAGATTLAADITSGATSLTLASASGLPGTYPFTLILDSDTVAIEVVTVTGAPTAGAYPVLRGQDGTVAQAHTAGAKVIHGLVARDLKGPQDHMDAATGVHGVTGSVVGTTDTQTLSNKTLGQTIFTPVPDGAAIVANGSIAMTRTAGSITLFNAKLQGDAANRINITSTPSQISLGDGTGVGDANLWRSSASTLQTDNFKITNGGSALDLGGALTYTPAWQAGAGAAIGNGTIKGTYYQVGKLVYFNITWTAGSTTNFGATGTAWSFSLPPLAPAFQTNFPMAVSKASGARYLGQHIYVGGGTGTSSQRLQVMSATSNGGTVSLGADQPATWASGDQIFVSGTYLVA